MTTDNGRSKDLEEIRHDLWNPSRRAPFSYSLRSSRFDQNARAPDGFLFCTNVADTNLFSRTWTKEERIELYRETFGDENIFVDETAFGMFGAPLPDHAAVFVREVILDDPNVKHPRLDR